MATIKAGTYKFKDSPTLQALRQQALRFTCTAESGVTENWYFIEVSTSQIAYNNEDADYPQTAYSNGVWNSTYSFRQTIALATDQSVSDEFYTWFKANIELSIHNQVEQFISDAYDAVDSKQGTIPTNKNLQNLVGAITSISTGVDTSDGNIEPTTVLKGYKGYAKGVAVNGAIETYDGTVEDVPYTDCLTFTGETGEFTLKATNKAWDGTLQWSTDHNTWTTLRGTEVMQSVDKKLYLRGKGNTTFFDRTNWVSVQWVLSAKAGCIGNIQTLLDWENPPTSISKNECYLELFANCTNLTSAPELPAMTLAMFCYQSIFENCTNLIIAPEVLPATTLAGGCYQSMFKGCTNLTSAPKLPATTLDASCYAQMFSGCTSLIAAPELPATTLLSGCYDRMFNGCANLKVNITSGNKIFTCPSTIPVGAVQYMFDNTGGTFTGTPTAGTTYYYTL